MINPKTVILSKNGVPTNIFNIHETVDTLLQHDVINVADLSTFYLLRYLLKGTNSVFKVIDIDGTIYKDVITTKGDLCNCWDAKITQVDDETLLALISGTTLRRLV